MQFEPQLYYQLWLNHPQTVRQKRRQLLQTFWIGVLLLILWQAFTLKSISFLTLSAAIIIAIFSLLPTYLWCSGKALGMPIFPVFALTYVWTDAIPLLSEHPILTTYSPEAHFFAAITDIIFLGTATFIWFQFVKSLPPIPKAYRAPVGQKGENFFLLILVLGILFNMYFLGGWFFLTGGIFALIRGAVFGLNALSVFVLSYNFGTKQLSRNKSILFINLLILYLITSAAGLIIWTAISVFILALAAYILGRGKLPLVTIIIMFVITSLLHYGKAEMRSQYWFGNQAHFVQPWEYPAWYAEWIGYSLDYLQKTQDNEVTQEKASLTERSSLIQMLLLAQQKSPSQMPYLYGKTYAIIPQLLVPRILNPNKIRSHEGTAILSVYYGLQTQTATLTTTIGWGLLAESYANFGLLGCTGLGIILGTAYGKITRWCLITPILSARSLFGVLIISFGFQTEWTAGVYVAALFQASIVLLTITLLFMKVHQQRLPSGVYTEGAFHSNSI